FGTLDLVVDAGHGQAAFFAHLALVAAPGDLGIDEHAQFIAVFGYIDHDDTFVDIDLRGGEPDTGSLVHGLGHVAHEFANTVIDFLDGTGLLEEARIRVMQNGKCGHGKYHKQLFQYYYYSLIACEDPIVIGYSWHASSACSGTQWHRCN